MITKILFTGGSFWVLLGAASGFADTVDPFAQVSPVSVAPTAQLTAQNQASVIQSLLSMLATQQQQQSITNPVLFGLYGSNPAPVQQVQNPSPTIVNVYNNIGDTSVNGVANNKVNKTLDNALKSARITLSRGEHSAVPSVKTEKTSVSSEDIKISSSDLASLSERMASVDSESKEKKEVKQSTTPDSDRQKIKSDGKISIANASTTKGS